MCGILGIHHPDEKFVSDFIKNGLKIQQNRGIDASGVASSKEISISKNQHELTIPTSPLLIAHNLHAIINHIPQPLARPNLKLVANCEIYNWEQLAKEQNVAAKNDAEYLLSHFANVDKSNVIDTLNQLDGVYASCVWKDQELFLFRDIIGVKPLFYTYNKEKQLFAFASEQKTLTKQGFVHTDVVELNPRHILIYNTESNELTTIQRPFFESKTVTQSKEDIIAKLETLFFDALKKRIPNLGQNKVGVLFSGGIDSTLICYLLKKHNIPFTAYTAALSQDGMSEADDLTWARRISKKLDFPLVENLINLEQMPKYLEQVVPLIESSNVIKVGVALPFYLSCEAAQKDNIRVIFSGLGSEEIFAGYQRHEKSADINQECVSGLRKMYERDLYRDDVLTMHHNIELRLPFLDKELIEYALTIDADLKIVREVKKYILREMAKNVGLDEEYADRPKKAAQYGSKFDRAIQKMANKNGFVLKSAYLNTFFPPQNQRLGVLFSSGKDSTYAMHTMMNQQYPIACLMTIKSSNDDSYMFHTPAIDVANLQAEALGFPIIMEETSGEKEIELDDLKRLIKRGVSEYQIDGIVTGALYSVYQRERIEKIAEELGIKVFSPLWHIDQEKEMRTIVEQLDYKLVFTGVAAYGLDKSWINVPITSSHIDKLAKLEKDIGINVAGEGGEFESLVLDCPLFSKRIEILDSDILETGENSARLVIKNAKLVEK